MRFREEEESFVSVKSAWNVVEHQQENVFSMKCNET